MERSSITNAEPIRRTMINLIDKNLIFNKNIIEKVNTFNKTFEYTIEYTIYN